MCYTKKISGFSDEITEDIDTQFATLNKLGISYFEPMGINGKNISTLNDDEVEQLKQKMQEYAKQEDVILLHENEGDIYGETIGGNLDIMQSLYCDNFKMVFDWLSEPLN